MIIMSTVITMIIFLYIRRILRYPGSVAAKVINVINVIILIMSGILITFARAFRAAA